MKKTKKIVKATRNWLVGICGVSLIMGLFFGVAISLPVMFLDLIQKKKVEFLKLIELPAVFMGVSCSMIVAGIFFRLFEQAIDKDPVISQKVQKINQSELKNAFSNFMEFFS